MSHRERSFDFLCFELNSDNYQVQVLGVQLNHVKLCIRTFFLYVGSSKHKRNGQEVFLCVNSMVVLADTRTLTSAWRRSTHVLSIVVQGLC